MWSFYYRICFLAILFLSKFFIINDIYSLGTVFKVSICTKNIGVIYITNKIKINLPITYATIQSDRIINHNKNTEANSANTTGGGSKTI